MSTDAPGDSGRIDGHGTEAYLEAMGQWDLEIRQVSPGELHWNVDYVRVGPMLLYRERFTRRALFKGATPPGSVMIACSRSGRPGIDWCGEQVHAGRLVLEPSATEIGVITPEDNEHVILEVPGALLERVAPDVNAALPRKSGHHLVTDARLGTAFIRTIDGTITRYLARSDLLADARVCLALERELVDHLTTLFLYGCVSMDRSTRADRRVALDRALEVVHAQHQQITLHELASAAGTHPRTLQRAFKETLQMSPLKYLSWSRMHGARRDLRAADPSSSSVTEIGLRWGFTELGRFAGEYRLLFGELPQATLMRGPGPPPRDLYATVRDSV